MLGQYIMLLVVPLTLADSNQHNLADSTDSTRLHWIPQNYGKFHQSPPNLAHVILLESSGMCGAV